MRGIFLPDNISADFSKRTFHQAASCGVAYSIRMQRPLLDGSALHALPELRDCKEAIGVG